jgi:hypothetical protein
MKLSIIFSLALLYIILTAAAVDSQAAAVENDFSESTRVKYSPKDARAQSELLPFGAAAAASSNYNANKEFWETIYQNSIFNVRTTYNALSGDRVCMSCPIDRSLYNTLYVEAMSQAGYGGAAQNPTRSSSNNNGGSAGGGSGGDYPPRFTISWTTQLGEGRTIFFCRNNTKITSTPVYISINDENDIVPPGRQPARGGGGGGGGGGPTAELDYTCENNRLCLINVRHNFPVAYQCLFKSFIQSVKLNVIGKSSKIKI